MKKLTRHKFAFLITFLSIIVMFGATGYLLYNGALLKDIENEIRLAAAIAIGVIALFLFILGIRYLKKWKRIKLVLVILAMLIFSGVQVFAGYNIGKVYGSIEKVTHNTGYTTYSSSLVTLKDNKVESIDKIGNEKLGVMEDKTSIEGSIIPKEVIKKKKLSNETVEYDSYIAMIDALNKGDIKYIFLPTNYSIMFGSIEGYENLKETTKIIYTQTKKMKKEESSNKNLKPITEPFTVLLMGVDSEEEGIESGSFNGDSLIVITFNPKNLTTTMLSIPRDSYVPISCFANKKKNKITHAAWRGEECMQKTIEDFLDIDIDYYVKINFKGVVKLVDTLGGVEVDVPYNLCEQDSNRWWGDNTVYIEKGHQTLNGEQALAFSRNRHPNPDHCSAKWTNYNSNDFIRGQNQQEVIKALLNKLKTTKDLDTVYKLLDTISTNMNTNMSTDQILSLYNIFKDISSKASNSSDMADLIGIQRLYLNGHDQRIIDYGGTNLSLYNYVLYDDSIKAVSDAMKENLGLKKAKTIKKFSFNINNPYEETIIGKDKTSKSSLTLVPSFVGQSLSYVNSFCSAHGIKVNVQGGNGTVISQSVPAGANVEDVSSITVTLSGGNVANNTIKEKTTTESTTIKEEEEEPTNVVPGSPGNNDSGSGQSGSGGSGGSTGGQDTGGTGGNDGGTSGSDNS